MTFWNVWQTSFDCNMTNLLLRRLNTVCFTVVYMQYSLLFFLERLLVPLLLRRREIAGKVSIRLTVLAEC